LAIDVADESCNFKVKGSLLTTANGTEIVRCFGREREIIVSRKVEILGRSCFESCNHVERIVFRSGSKLNRICQSALSGCEFLASIAVPASVITIEESAFKKCDGLESCSIDENANLVRIGKEAFADCRSLRSFYVPKNVDGIGDDCFRGCGSLCTLRFGSGESLSRILGGLTLDERLGNIGFNEISRLFRIEMDPGEVDLEFPGWVSVVDRGSILIFVQAGK
jgi:hypothetical protein